MITGLHHIQLAAPPGAEPVLRAFYGGVLGLTEVAKPEALAARGGAWFSGPGLDLHIGIEESFRLARKAHPGILVSDLDALAARLTEAGFDLAPDVPLENHDGRRYRRFHAHDPVGNRLEFLQLVSH